MDRVRRVVQLPGQPAQRRARAAVDEPRSRYTGVHAWARPPDLLVPGLRRRPLLVHRPRPHQGVLRRADFRSTSSAASRPPRASSKADCARHADAASFEKVTLDDNTQNPMELDVAQDGRVFYIERDGRLQIIKPDTQQTVTAGADPGLRAPGERPARHRAGPGLRHQQLGLPLLLAAAGHHDGDRLSRVHGQRRHARPRPARRSSSTFRHQRARVLPLRRRRWPSTRTATSTSPPATTPTRSPPTASTPIDERPGRGYWDAQRTRGQHQRPQRQDPAHQPLRPDGARRRHDYTIPAGNLFPAGHGARPGPRSTAWASATRSASRSTRRPAGS